MVRHVVLWAMLAVAVASRTVLAAPEDKTVERLAPPLGCNRLTLADGLPNPNVHTIVQDVRGFMWFGTGDGLARYDGTKFRVYRPVEKDPTSVSSPYISALALDPSGKIWVGTLDSGVNLYDPETDKFTRFTTTKGGLSSEGVTAILRDKKDRVWFAMSGGGLDRFDATKGTFADYVTKPLDVPVTALGDDHDGNLWIGTETGGVFRWNPDTGATTEPEDLDVGGVAIRALRVASNGTVWIGSYGSGLFALDPATGTVAQYSHDPADPTTITDDHIWALFEAQNKSVWIGTTNGLNRIDSSRRVIRYKHDPSDPNNPTRIPFPTVDSMYQDRKGLLWVGGFTGGLCKFDEARAKFGHYYTSAHTTAFFEEPDGGVWVATYNGLKKYDWAAQRVTTYFNLTPSQQDEPSFPLASVWITSVHERNGTLWLSVLEKGLLAFDLKTETFRHYPNDPAALPVDTIFDMWEDPRGLLWLATWGGGLVRFDPKQETFTAFTTGDSNGDDSSGISSNHIYKLYPDPTDKKILWLGTAKGGLVRFNIESSTSTNFRHRNNDPASLSSDDILSIYREPGGAVWVGTFGGGLNRMDPATGKAESFTAGNSGITNNTIYGVLAGDDGRLWLATNGSGLVAFDPKAKTFLTYDSSDGVQANEFVQGSFMRGKHGQLFFGGTGGFNVFKPGDITRDPYPPPVALTAFKVSNQEVQLERPIWTLPSLKVSYLDSFEVQFSALDFVAPMKNRYAYKLEGFDEKFIETDRPYATYTKLSGGEYTLRVRAANRHGVWTEKPISLKLRVTPPWWRSWPAYGAFMLLLVFAAILLVRAQRLRVQRAEREGRLAVVERDLALTGAVQSGFLPEYNEIATPHLQLCGLYRPADACSGDWWWHEQLADGRHLIIVGDVSGHGPGPAMVTAAVATAFRVLIEEGVHDVRRVLERLNHEVLRVAKGKYHMTVAALEVVEATGAWVLHSAGAPPILSLNTNGKHKVHFCPGSPLGTAQGFETGQIEGQFQPTERVLIYTDGIPEITQPNGKIIGMRKFAQHYEQTRAQPVHEAAASMVLIAEKANGREPQMDDWTFTILEWN